MKIDNKSGFHWYTAAWRFGAAAHAHTASSSPNQSRRLENTSAMDTDWYVKGLQLGTSADMESDDMSLAHVRREACRAIAHTWQSLRNLLSVSDEPRLWQTTDSQGDILWNAYDPKTNHYVEGLTEQNMRIWLEERYAR
jgi:hypothetical protein